MPGGGTIYYAVNQFKRYFTTIYSLLFGLFISIFSALLLSFC